MLTTELYSLDLTALAQEIAGRIVTPADPDWDTARAAWNLAVDQRPAAVAFPANADDVIAIVDSARRRGLKVAPQGTGHNAAPLADLSDTIIIRTSEMRGVHVDAEAARPRRSRARCGAISPGVASDAGLAPPWPARRTTSASSATRSAAALSWLARRHGLAADNVPPPSSSSPPTAGTCVPTPAARTRSCSGRCAAAAATSASSPRWSCALFEVTDLYAGSAALRLEERAGEVLQAWREWTATVPDEITSIGHVVRFPPLPENPRAAGAAARS